MKMDFETINRLGTPITTSLSPNNQNSSDDSEDFNSLHSPTTQLQNLSINKTKLAFLTSGGDAQGMNAAIRAIVRVAIYNNVDVFAVYEGYQGLVDGTDDKIKQMHWNDVAHIINVGGTVVQSARCSEFREKAGRFKACINLVKRGIDILVVIGGDGSLTGASILRSEWPQFIEEAKNKNLISSEQASSHPQLKIVGLVGSIDNDMIGTDVTIGANSALHRIVEAVDCLLTTASSHRRAFVVEVMGRKCGWLAVMSCIASGADYVFIPEKPAQGPWEDDLCRAIGRKKDIGKQIAIVIVAEGATDHLGKPIKADQVSKVLNDKLNISTRVTTLGHVQRGGSPSAFDRYLATLQGVKAVETVLRSSWSDEPSVIGMNYNKIVCIPLKDSVDKTRLVSHKLENLQFDESFHMRDEDFQRLYSVFIATNLEGEMSLLKQQRDSHLNHPIIAVIHNGAPACGMNATTKTLVQHGLSRGFRVVTIHGGFPGLIQEDYCEPTWLEVDGWTNKGGSLLGTNRILASECCDQGLSKVESILMDKIKCSALIVIGGFEAFQSVLEINNKCSRLASEKIPVVCLPCTVSNNIPGTEYSVGSDTALNVIVESCDRLKQSATSSHKRVFVLEVQGGNCGYLATVGGLAGSATYSYIPEEGVTLGMLQRDARHLQTRYFCDSRQGRVVIRNENCSSTYSTPIITSILGDEGKGIFDTRSCILGHLQQGGLPSPLDRIYGTRLAVKSIEYIEQQLLNNKKEEQGKIGVVVGVLGSKVVISSIESLEKEVDLEKRRPKNQWWLSMRPLCKMLAKYENLHSPFD